METEQVCPRCERLFPPNRSWHVCCSPECRKQRWIEKSVQAERTRSRPPRPLSKNGYGARVYITPREVGYLMALVSVHRGPQRLKDKLLAAAERMR